MGHVDPQWELDACGQIHLMTVERFGGYTERDWEAEQQAVAERREWRMRPLSECPLYIDTPPPRVALCLVCKEPAVVCYMEVQGRKTGRIMWVYPMEAIGHLCVEHAKTQRLIEEQKT